MVDWLLEPIKKLNRDDVTKVICALREQGDAAWGVAEIMERLFAAEEVVRQERERAGKN
jgi:hypothetical protein